jgi:hypothetical protein
MEYSWKCFNVAAAENDINLREVASLHQNIFKNTMFS